MTKRIKKKKTECRQIYSEKSVHVISFSESPFISLKSSKLTVRNSSVSISDKIVRKNYGALAKYQSSFIRHMVHEQT